MHVLSQQFKDNGCSQPAFYENCEHPPLVGNKGCVIDKVSCLPLHVALGLGVKNLNAVENQAWELDAQVKDFDGVDTAQFKNLT